ncbi:restriction endonuclease [Rhodocyclus purpureus]|uniref:restriction endonuclease n=1 Tax=Rhodocyclus purpureus TaxID=1067 RepID=UPI001912632B|nr:restriction endonuclease [Rhodocyclus purpureus]MBK5913858.1 hypothetical protein [Rhodocyclus purpureus]
MPKPDALDFSSLWTRPSEFPKNCVGYMADQLAMPVEILIGQFEAAGIRGLAPYHKLRDRDRTALLEYLPNTHRHPPLTVLLYEHGSFSHLDIQTVSEISTRLVEYLASHPEAMYSLAPRKFEELVAFLLEKEGCEVTLTKATRDGGYDIWAKMSTPISKLLILAECKRYDRQNKVGVEVVRGLYGVTEAHRANQGIIVTSSFFTKDAREEQMRIGNRISLSDFDHLSKWLSRHAVGNDGG